MLSRLVGRNGHCFQPCVSGNLLGGFIPWPLVLSSHVCSVQHHVASSRGVFSRFQSSFLGVPRSFRILFRKLQLPCFTWPLSSISSDSNALPRFPFLCQWPRNALRQFFGAILGLTSFAFLRDHCPFLPLFNDLKTFVLHISFCFWLLP